MKLKINFCIFTFLYFFINAAYSDTVIMPQYYAIESKIKDDKLLSEIIDKVKNYLNENIIKDPYPTIFTHTKHDYSKKFIEVKDFKNKNFEQEVLIIIFYNKEKNGVYNDSIATYKIKNGKRLRTSKCSMSLYKIIDGKEVALSKEELENKIIKQIGLISFKFNPPEFEYEK